MWPRPTTRRRCGSTSTASKVASTSSTATLFNSASALRIGGNTVWGEWFSGLIDEVRIYERALTATEIQADSERAVAP
jgi:hypothetical protein